MGYTAVRAAVNRAREGLRGLSLTGWAGKKDTGVLAAFSCPFPFGHLLRFDFLSRISLSHFSHHRPGPGKFRPLRWRVPVQGGLPGLLVLVCDRASGFLKSEACVCLERTSFRAGIFCSDTRCCVSPKTIPSP